MINITINNLLIITIEFKIIITNIIIFTPFLKIVFNHSFYFYHQVPFIIIIVNFLFII
jgi:hypothetical protein